MDITRFLPKDFNLIFFNYWISGWTNEEISFLTNVDKHLVDEEVYKFYKFNYYPVEVLDYINFGQSCLRHELEDEFMYPIFNVWQFNENRKEESFYEKRILSSLLYLYSEPLDMVIDPFAGKGSTIEICKNRLRRFWVSDRKLYGPRCNQIRELDILKNMPLIEDWNKVSITFLDPPYWNQAAGKYSNDPDDLGNMSLDKFTESIIQIVQNFAIYQKKGVIALTMRSTQESRENDHFVDHTIQIINNIHSQKLILENRISCPYSINRYNSNRIEWYKQNRKLFVNNREIIIWRICEN